MTSRPTVSLAPGVAGDTPIPDLTRYQLHVIAARVVEVVEFVGGWLFDRAMAGWQVTVLLASPDQDPLPLHILGGEVVDLGTRPLLDGCRPSPDALAVAADLCHRDISIREEVQHALDCGRSEVALWGPPWHTDTDLHGHVDVVEYRLSIAARAFKARALAATVQPIESTPVIEVIRSYRTALVSTRTGLPDRLPAVNVDGSQ
jgi:hypothetical protein